MFGSYFYNQTTRRYVALFGTLFNNISYARTDSRNVTEYAKVPLNYGPMQKFLARIQQNPDLTAPAIVLPRMSFEIINIDYDGERRLTGAARAVSPNPANSTVANVRLSPIPYNINFRLNLMVKNSEDGLKILEQILPYFNPAFTVTAAMVDGMEPVDIPVVLNSVETEDTYEANFEERRVLIWTLTFTVKGYYYGPSYQKKLIKFANTSIYSTMDQNADPVVRVTVQPGLTANGQPTTDINQTVPYADISIDDDWAHIVRIIDL